MLILSLLIYNAAKPQSHTKSVFALDTYISSSTYLFILSPAEAITFAQSEGIDVLIQTKDNQIYTTLEKDMYEIKDRNYTLSK